MACPVCARETEAKFRPFCSKRCADVDLAKWLTGAYAIPVEAVDEDDDTAFPEDPEGDGRPN